MTSTSPSVPLHAIEVGSGPRHVVFLHGLFGRGRNFSSIAKSLGEQFTSLLVDLPNHGASDWTEETGYPAMADTVAEHLEAGFTTHGPVAVVGHSMGGKVAMMLALRHPDLVERLVVADIAPVDAGESRGNFTHLLDSLARLDLVGLHNRGDADRALSHDVPEDSVRSFLLQNLRRGEDGLEWQPNLRLLRRELPTITGWPATRTEPYPGPVLWLAGSESDYVQDKDANTMRALFPRTRKVVIKGAGHWIHAEKPREFVSALRAFLMQEEADT